MIEHNIAVLILFYITIYYISDIFVDCGIIAIKYIIKFITYKRNANVYKLKYIICSIVCIIMDIITVKLGIVALKGLMIC